MRKILPFFVLLLFVAGCGGGSEGDTSPSDPGEVAEFSSISDVSNISNVLSEVTADGFCSPLLTTVAPLPEGDYPSWFIDVVNAVPPSEDGSFFRLGSDGTMSGNWGSDADTSDIISIPEDCVVGTRPPDFAGHWVYTQDMCFCLRFDVLPGVVLCGSVDPESEDTACSHHSAGLE